jgi:hypothetical protein
MQHHPLMIRYLGIAVSLGIAYLAQTPKYFIASALYNYYRCMKCRGVGSLPARKIEEEFLALLDRLRVSSSFSTEFEATIRNERLNKTNDSAAAIPEEIAAIERQIAEAEQGKGYAPELLDFSKSMLVDIPSPWRHANVDQKQRVQNLVFFKWLNLTTPKRGI